MDQKCEERTSVRPAVIGCQFSVRTKAFFTTIAPLPLRFSRSIFMKNALLLPLPLVGKYFALGSILPQNALICSSWAAAQTSAFTLPATPSEIAVPAGQKVAQTFLGHGTQNYACQEKADESGFEWTFKALQAELLDSSEKKVGSHYAGPTWEAPDGSKVVGEVRARAASKDSIPWLLLSAKSNAGTGLRHFAEVLSQGRNASRPKGVATGRRFSRKWSQPKRSVGGAMIVKNALFSKVTFIQRLSTTGGLAPTTGCEAATVGSEAKMTYTALYVYFEVQ